MKMQEEADYFFVLKGIRNSVGTGVDLALPIFFDLLQMLDQPGEKEAVSISPMPPLLFVFEILIRLF